MKRILSLITLIAMLATMTLSVPVFADSNAKLDLKQAIEVAKKSFDISTENYDFTSNYSETNYGKKLWYLYWNSKSGNGSSMSATIDASTGEIINMSRWDAQATPPGRIPKYSRDEALKAAQAMASRLNPGKFKETALFKLDDNNIYFPYYSSDVYSFSFIRKVKGIDFPNNNIVVNVDKNTLTIRYYNVDWDDVIPIPDSSKAISNEAAKKIFSEKLGIELAYQMIYPNPTGDPKVILTYNLRNGNQPIDALTGEIITKPYQGPMYNMAEKSSATGRGDGAYVPTPEEQKVIDDTSKYITKEKAIEAVKKYITIDSKYKVDNSSLYGNQRLNDATWNFSWSYSDKEKNTYSYISAAVDAVSGELKNFYINNSEDEPKKGETPKYTEAQCKELGEKLLKEIQPDKFSSVEFRKPAVDYTIKTANIPSYNFNYIRKVNGISFPSNNLNVTVSAYTGKVTGFNMTWNNPDFPDAKGTISLGEAYKILYGKSDLLLNYVRIYNYEQFNENTQIKLVYTLNNYNGMIDAKSGQFIDYNGNPIKDTVKTSFTDIKGHKNEADIKLLVDLGIIESAEDKFNPDNKILQKDFIKFLMKAIQPEYIIYAPANESSEYDRYYEMAIQQNIISKQDKNPDANVTRIEASKMLVKALGVGFVADLNNIYVLGFKDEKDVASADKGYAAITSALELIDTTAGSFIPNEQITKAGTASMLVKFLKVNKTPKDSAVVPLVK